MSVRDYSRIEQQRAPKSNGLQPQYSGSQFKFLHKLNGNIRPKFVDSKPSANLFGTTRSCVTKLSANFLPHPPSQQKMDQGWLLLRMGEKAHHLPWDWRLVPWIVLYSKHELAGHQGVGESPPRATVCSSKLKRFPLAKQG